MGLPLINYLYNGLSYVAFLYPYKYICSSIPYPVKREISLVILLCIISLPVMLPMTAKRGDVSFFSRPGAAVFGAASLLLSKHRCELCLLQICQRRKVGYFYNNRNTLYAKRSHRKSFLFTKSGN
jgi:hypothetical protein